MELALIIGGSVIAGLVLIAFVVWAHQYTKVVERGPDHLRSAAKARLSPRARRRHLRASVPRAGAPVPRADAVRRADVETYSAHGVPVQVDGVCMVKIDGTDEGIERAAEQFLSRREEDIVRTAMQAVEACAASAIGGLSIEDIYRDRQRLVDGAGARCARPRAHGAHDPVPHDPQRRRQAGLHRGAGTPAHGPGQARRDPRRGGRSGRPRPPYDADLAIERSRRDYEIEKSHFRSEGMRVGRGGPLLRAAEGDLEPAGPRRAARRGNHRAQEGDRADAGRGRSPAARAECGGHRAGARAGEEIMEIAEAEREQAAALGAGEADALRAKGLAEAEAMAAKAESWQGYNEGGDHRSRARILPELASAVSAPLAHRQDRDDRRQRLLPGAAKITKDVTQVMAEMPAVLEALTGKKLADTAKHIPQVGEADTEGSAEDWVTPLTVERYVGGRAVEAKDVLALAQGHAVRMVDFKFTDLPGTWQHLGLSIHSLDEDAFAEGLARRLVDPRLPGDRGLGHGAAAGPDRADRPVPRARRCRSSAT